MSGNFLRYKIGLLAISHQFIFNSAYKKQPKNNSQKKKIDLIIIYYFVLKYSFVCYPQITQFSFNIILWQFCVYKSFCMLLGGPQLSIKS